MRDAEADTSGVGAPGGWGRPLAHAALEGRLRADSPRACGPEEGAWGGRGPRIACIARVAHRAFDKRVSSTCPTEFRECRGRRS